MATRVFIKILIILFWYFWGILFKVRKKKEKSTLSTSITRYSTMRNHWAIEKREWTGCDSSRDYREVRDCWWIHHFVDLAINLLICTVGTPLSFLFEEWLWRLHEITLIVLLRGQRSPMLRGFLESNGKKKIRKVSMINTKSHESHLKELRKLTIE